MPVVLLNHNVAAAYLIPVETFEKLMDAGYLTALLTGAISGLATKYFSRDVPSTVTSVGTGVQAITLNWLALQYRTWVWHKLYITML